MVCIETNAPLLASCHQNRRFATASKADNRPPVRKSQRPLSLHYPNPPLRFVAEQLGLDAAHFGDYAERDQTRREHVLEIETALGLRPLTGALYRELAAWLLATALATDHGPTLVTTLLEELRARRIVCPSPWLSHRQNCSMGLNRKFQRCLARLHNGACYPPIGLTLIGTTLE
jgi:hypothetical protein